MGSALQVTPLPPGSWWGRRYGRPPCASQSDLDDVGLGVVPGGGVVRGRKEHVSFSGDVQRAHLRAFAARIDLELAEGPRVAAVTHPLVQVQVVGAGLSVVERHLKREGVLVPRKRRSPDR